MWWMSQALKAVVAFYVLIADLSYPNGDAIDVTKI